MSREEPVYEKLRTVFSAPEAPAAATAGCASDEEIWAASRGELPAERGKELLAHSLDCAACRESWKVALALAREAALDEPAKVIPFRALRRRLVPFAAAAAVLLLAFIVIPLIGRKQLTEPVPTWAAAVQTTLWQVGDGSDRPLTGGDSVRPGDRIYLTLDSEVPVHVYVINRDRTGESTVLFPIDGAQWTNPLPAGPGRRLPGDIRWPYDSWEVSSAGGQESFMILASAEPLAELESAIALLDAAVPDQEYLRGEDPAGRDPEADPAAGESALSVALRNLAERTPNDTVIVREIVLENPK